MKQISGIIVYPLYVSRHPDFAFGWLAEEADRCGISLKPLFLEDMYVECGSRRTESRLFVRGEEMETLPDFVLIRGYDTVVSRFFEDSGVRVINSGGGMVLSKDKVLTHMSLSRSGIPSPKTVYVPGGGYDYAEMRRIFGSGRFIVKRIDGAKGEDVFLVDCGMELDKAVEACSGNCLCQEFVESSCGRDVRVWVIGDRVAGSVLRYSDSSFKSNYSQGGKAELFSIDDRAARMCVDATRLLGLEFAGVDLLFDGAGGFMVCEVNGNAGFRTLSLAGPDNPVPRMLFEYIAGLFRA